MYGKTGKNFRVKGTGQFSSVKMERDERVPFTPSYSLRDWVLTIRHLNMATGFAFENLLDDTCLFYFIEEDDVPVFATAAVVARRSLNRCQGYFEQTVPF